MSEAYYRLLVSGSNVYRKGVVTDEVGVGHTDAYKMSMAQAGFPLRRETFYLSMRTGGPHFIPFDFKAVAQVLVERLGLSCIDGTKIQKPFTLTATMDSALQGKVKIWAAPAGSWVVDREPIISITGPSFLASWLEPLVIMWRFPIQVATAIKKGESAFRYTTENEKEIILLVADVLGADVTVTKDLDFWDDVRSNITDILEVLGGDTTRVFELGLRAATCWQQHLQVLQCCKQAGIWMTSSLQGAATFGMVPVGTTGHEHQQRWGSDLAAFRAVRDMRAEMPIYLFDTFDPFAGIRAAIQVMEETPNRLCAVRFDSGDQEAQFQQFMAAERAGRIKPTYIFEDGFTTSRTAQVEHMVRQAGISPSRVLYGYGGFITNPPGAAQFRRDDVSAVYKLSQSGTEPVMKICGSKSSIPGVLEVLVGPQGERVVAQQGEALEGYRPLAPSANPPSNVRTNMSPKTQALIEKCHAKAQQNSLDRSVN